MRKSSPRSVRGCVRHPRAAIRALTAGRVARILLAGVSLTVLTTGPASGAAAKVLLRATAIGEGSLSTGDGRIDCGVQCSARYKRGSVITVTASPADSFFFNRWTAGCVGNSTSCSVALDQATTVTAEFLRIPQNVRITVGGPGNVVSDPRGIDCGQLMPACAASFGQGQVIRLTPVPAADGAFLGWGGPCQGAPVDGCDLTVGVNDEVTATFRHPSPPAPPGPGGANTGLAGAPPPGSNAVTVHGLVDSSPSGLTCKSSTCSGSFAVNTPVTLTGRNSWGGDCVGEGSTCTVLPDVAITVDANEVEGGPAGVGIGLNVSVSGRGLVTGGRIRCGQARGTLLDCETSVTQGTSVVLTASPRSRFVGWRGFCGGRRPTCPTRVFDSETIQAIFHR